MCNVSNEKCVKSTIPRRLPSGGGGRDRGHGGSAGAGPGAPHLHPGLLPRQVPHRPHRPTLPGEPLS